MVRGHSLNDSPVARGGVGGGEEGSFQAITAKIILLGYQHCKSPNKVQGIDVVAFFLSTDMSDSTE